MTYLTSTGFTNSPELREVVKSQYSPKTKFTIIINAAEDGSKNKYAQLAKQQLQGFGYIDINFVDLTKKPDQKIITNSGLIYILGGNTFKLMDDINKSGFKEALISKIKVDGCIGVSAGSIILGQSIATASIGDGDENNVGLTDLSGLKLLDFDVSPHYTKQDEDEITAYETKTGRKVERIADDQIIVIDKIG